jgi:hypothetical protein
MNQQGQVLDFIKHFSQTPWSDYTAADYSIEQWHAACLIHQHEGPPTSKSQCKLPIKTPDGAVNKNGVHAAAAALAGARGGVNASSEQKASAARALRGYYKQMNEDPPSSLMQSNIENLIEHHGVKGMHWGSRAAKRSVSGRSAKVGQKVGKPLRKARLSRQDKKWQKNIYSVRGAVAIHNNVADKMNNGGLNKLNSNPKYKNMKFLDSGGNIRHGDKTVDAYMREYEKMNVDFTRQAVKEVHGKSPSGNLKATLDTSDPAQWKVIVSSTETKHAVDTVPTLIMEVEHDDHYITLVKNVKEQVLEQSERIEDFINHHGVKGMHWGVRRARSGVRVSSDFKKTAPHRGKKPSQLSNKQLKAVNERVNLEQNYRRMNPTTVKKGLNIAKGTLALASTAISIHAMYNSPAGKAAIAAGKKALKK